MTDATKKTGYRKTRGPFSNPLIEQLLSQASGASAGAFLRQSASSLVAGGQLATVSRIRNVPKPAVRPSFSVLRKSSL